MNWQDITITLCNVIFTFALIPQVYEGFKTKTGHIKIQTALPYSLALGVMAFALYTLKLPFSSAITFIAGMLWGLLGIQTIRYRKK